MDIIVSATSSAPRVLVPADSHIARCVEIIQIGTVKKEFAGETKELSQVRLTWELPELMREYDGKEEPARIAETYTLSLHEKAGLRKVLKSWRGRDFTAEELKGFSLKNILGATCMLSVTHTQKGEKTYANVTTVSKLHKSMVCPDQINESKMLGYGPDFDYALFDSLPGFLKDQMKTTPQYAHQLREWPRTTPEPVAGNFPPASGQPALPRDGGPAKGQGQAPDQGDDSADLPF